MQRVINTIEKNVESVPLAPLAVPAGTSVKALPTLVGDPYEYAGRCIYNAGSVNLYYAFGHDVNPTNYEGICYPAQEFNASACGMALYVAAPAGGADGVVSRSLFRRNDLSNVNAGILYPSVPAPATPERPL